MRSSSSIKLSSIREDGETAVDQPYRLVSLGTEVTSKCVFGHCIVDVEDETEQQAMG